LGELLQQASPRQFFELLGSVPPMPRPRLDRCEQVSPATARLHPPFSNNAGPRPAAGQHPVGVSRRAPIGIHRAVIRRQFVALFEQGKKARSVVALFWQTPRVIGKINVGLLERTSLRRAVQNPHLHSSDPCRR